MHAAARLLFVSPSALSRTIRLLEDHFGAALFERSGRNLVLTATGRELLEVVQRAMRNVDDVLACNATARQTLRIACSPGLADAVVMQAIARLQANQAGLTIALAGDPERDPVQRLLVGDLDVVLAVEPPNDTRVCSAVVREVRFGIYARADHRVVRDRVHALDALVEHPFVSYPVPPHPSADRWPTQLARTIGMYTHDARLAIDACRGGNWLAVLPDSLVAETADAQRAPLTRLELDVISPAVLHAVYRVPTGTRCHGETLLRALHECSVPSSLMRCAEHCHGPSPPPPYGRSAPPGEQQ